MGFDLGSIITGGIGAATGNPAMIAAGVGGLLGGQAANQLQTAQAVPQYTGVGGTATESGFQWQPNAQTASNTATANTQLGQMLGRGLMYDPAQAQQYTAAYLASRLPAMQQQQQQQAQQQAANISATGMAGSSGAAYQDALRQQFANQQLAQMQNEAVLGGQQLAQQDLQQKLASVNALNALTQQDFQNALQAQQAAAGNRIGSVSSNIGLANQNNLTQQAKLSNVFGGMGAGVDLAKGFGFGTGSSGAFGTGLNQSQFGLLPEAAQTAYRQASMGSYFNPETQSYSTLG